MTEGRDQRVEVIVTISDVQGATIDRVETALKNLNVEIIGVLRGLGIVNGVCRESLLGELKRIPGVSGVELSRQLRIDPPDSNVQ